MKLRLAEPRDIPALHALVERAYRGDSARRGWTHEADLLDGQRTDPELLAAMIDDPAQRVLLAGPPEQPMACAAVTDKGGRLAYLGMVTVDPERQGSGLGRALLESAEEWARANLATERMEMTVIVQRSELIDWYRRQGYQPTGERRPFPYDDPKAGTPRRDDLEFVVLEKRLR